MDKIWRYKEKAEEEQVNRLADELCVPKNSTNEKDRRTYRIIASLLIQRGIKTFEEAKKFFRPDLNSLFDPFLMNDMDKAVERIMIAISGGERILVYGDYDVDGTSAVALVYSYLEKFYPNVDYYIPDRYGEGYGVSFKGVDYAQENDIKLIICLDCGIKATQEIAYARERNIDFIVCDHHLPGQDLPNAYVILDPKLPDSTYPYKELSGCGVGFKLIQALQKRRAKPADELKSYLDLVAISIAADVVPVTGENRVLAFYGLKLINKSPRVGLEEILKYGNIKHTEDGTEFYFNRELSIMDLVFLIGPRINAAGRMDSGRNAVELLISKKREDAEKIAYIINENNESRKSKDQEATLEAKQKLQSLNLTGKKSIVLFNEQWHQGIIGIVASRLSEEECKPTIIFTKSNGEVVGSARSVKDFDIYSAIEKCRYLLTHFGGHKFAAGLSMKEENFEEFKRLFEKEVEDNIKDSSLVPEITLDMDIPLSDVNNKLLRILKQFSPFGTDNNEPVFSSRDVYDAKSVRKVGINHLKFSAIPINENIMPISCIGFSLSQYYDLLHNDNMVDICYTIEENNYQGRSELQLNVKDIKESEHNNNY